jgi:hypothetical protein
MDGRWLQRRKLAMKEWGEQLDIVTVTLLLSAQAWNKFLVRSKESRCAVTKLLNLYAILIFSAPPCQKFPGSIVLCIPLMQASGPIARYVCALSQVKFT